MQAQSIAESYRSKTVSMRRQIIFDITLKLLKLTADQIEELLLNIDRDFDAGRGINADFTGILFSDNNIQLEFEDLTRTTHILSLQELSLEDKIYLLEEIEKL